MPDNLFKIFSCNSNQSLASEIAKNLKVSLGECKISRFRDGEVYLDITESVRGYHCYVVQSLCTPVNDNVMELLIIIDALKRASAREITIVMPYYGYGRQDRKVRPREPITAKLIADLLETAGANRMISLDLHAAQIQGFFNIPFDHLYASHFFIRDIKEKFLKNCNTSDAVVVSPDAGGVERARSYAKKLGLSLAIIDKRRPLPGEAEVMNIIGDVQNKNAIIIDDMVDSAGTLLKGAEALIKFGAKSVCAYITHGVLSKPAIERITNGPIDSLVVSNSIPLSDESKKCKKIRVVSCGSLIAQAIDRVNNHESISSLFES